MKNFRIAASALLVSLGLSLVIVSTLQAKLREPDRSLDSVTLQLKWNHQFQFAGYYAAIEKGFYREAGLNVRLVPALPESQPMDEVLMGNAEFGVGTSDVLLLRAQGKPLVVLAAIFQHSPLVLLARKDAGIQCLHDLAGKRVMIEPHSAEIFAYLQDESVPAEALITVPHSLSPKELVAGTVAAMSAYSTDEPFLLEKAGIDYMTFTPRSGGIDFYGDCIFTTEDQVRAKPKRVKAFLEASLRGWNYALENPEEIVDLILQRYHSPKSREHLLFEASRMRRLIRPELVEIGYMNPGRWKHMAATYARLGMLSADFSFEGLLYKAEAEKSRLYWIIAALMVVTGGLALVSLRVYQMNLRWREEIRERRITALALQESQRHLSQIIDFLPDATFVIDRDGRVIAWNQAIEAMTGISSDHMIGKGNYEYALAFHGNRCPMLIDQVMRPVVNREEEEGISIEQSGDTMISESYHPFMGGEEVFLSTTARPLYDSEGHYAGAIESIRDITGRKRNEEALKIAKKQAEAATRATSEFLANVSHEIRTPLSAVLGMIDLLSGTHLTPSQQKRAHIIKSAAEALLDLLNDMLDLSKIEAGRLDLEAIDFDLRSVLSNAVSLLELRASDKNISLTYSVSDAVPRILNGDPNRLRQVMLNLINNAVKFTENGQVVVRTEAEDLSHEGVILHCSVADTGIGIPPQKLDSIFDRFTQADSSTARKYGGSGLGLPISHQLVKAMGGKMWVESNVGLGSTFHFTVPLALGNPVVDADSAISAEFPAFTGLEGMRVLLAEDNMFNQAVAVEVLNKLGCSVHVASDGKEAVEAFAQQPFDIILMDLQMPYMDGFEATRRIRETEAGATIPIIAQTAHAFDQDRERCIAAGMDEHIYKPITTRQLLRIFEKLGMDSIERNSLHPNPETDPAGTDAVGGEQKPVDIEDLLARLGDDPEDLKEFVGLFLDTLPPLLSDLKSAVASGQWDEVGRIAHQVRGTCVNLSAYRLAHTVSQIEQCTRELNVTRMESLAAGLDHEFNDLKEFLRESELG